ncbi:threonine/serine exporter family protein [Fructilactobacillus cliffordii]|uniref:Threonine/serine exporter family protein n=1 Tax=Fructilactobacillus cliffordii TaxID=2940299 RepID=A0A9Q8ZVI7_9LACO|nr:threonine/serine exporter family protein [Fructilactobacillus cliffordii]USS86223.1 threonine/serine exporter family protein [Fructilactobacillus cliffordii]USS89291.1 threonine/serine exporter family protein [Fructilactobacillus cliffordii]
MGKHENRSKKKQAYSNKVVQTCLLAGKILIENGSELNRVSDTIKRIADNAGLKDLNAYVTITGLMISANDEAGAQIKEIEKRDFDLRRIAAVNKLSRRFAEKKLTINQFYRLLLKVEHIGLYYPFWLLMVAAAVLSGAITVVFNNDIPDFFITSLVGMFGWLIFREVSTRVHASFISEFVAAMSIGAMAIYAVKFGLGQSVDNIIIGAVMPLVPGVPITNAVRDLISGNLISGPARGIEALICACALGFGVSLALIWLG